MGSLIFQNFNDYVDLNRVTSSIRGAGIFERRYLGTRLHADAGRRGLGSHGADDRAVGRSAAHTEAANVACG